VFRIACTDTISRIKGNSIGGESNVYVIVVTSWDSKDNWLTIQLGEKKQCFLEVGVDLE
jgi:hypothetical protein